jgi:Flp pilus assembly protein TadG
VIFAVAVPVLAVLGAGAIDLSSLSADRSRMQDAADGAALAAARQLGIGTSVGITARAQALANADLATVAARVPFTVTTTISPDNSQVTVAINGHRQSFFANLLPPGGWNINVRATAATLGQTPLCVLSSGANSANPFSLEGSSKATANGCLVHGNSDIRVLNSATLAAGTVQSAGNAIGAITPSPQIGAPQIPDPFASMQIKPPLPLCLPLNLLYNIGVNTVLPGTHCGNITVRDGATLYLLPGEHYFMKGSLQMKNNATLTGSDVVLVFDDASQFQFSDSSTINLSGRRSGVFAGFVIATTRNNDNTFEISSDSARQLLGTIYAPKATLLVTGTGNRVADQSAWTVVVAKSIKLTGSPNLVINHNYAGSNVPVPDGVGPTGDNKVMLKR